MKIDVVVNDGGRAQAGFKGTTGDCATRVISIATGRLYQKVYEANNALGARERTGKRKRQKSNARNGAFRQTSKRCLESLGWTWTPTMKIGSGCKVHLRADELPSRRLVCKVSRHLVAVIDGVIHDNHDSSRNGTRCVYGYYKKQE